MVKNKGFTLIELIIFIVVLGIISTTILTTIVFVLKSTPLAKQQTTVTTTATQCMEYLLGQRDLKGFNFDGKNCPGTPNEYSLPPPALCTTPGINTEIKIKCAEVTGFPGEQKFKLIKVTTTGEQSITTVLKLLVADY